MTFAASPFPRVSEIGKRILALQALFTALGFATATLDTALKAIVDNDGNQVLPNGYSSTEAQMQAAFETRAEVAEQALAAFEVAFAQSSGTNNQTIPTGAIIPFAGYTAPTGFLLCDGTAVSRATYATLFAAMSITQNGTHANGSPIITGLTDTSNMKVGQPVSGVGIPAGAVILTVDSPTQITLDQNATAATPLTGPIVVAPFGVGDGSTTFNTPDLRGKAPIGDGTGVGLTARAKGVVVGTETVTLDATNVPVKGVADGANTGHDATTGIAGQPLVGASAASAAVAHANMQPSLPVNFIVKT